MCRGVLHSASLYIFVCSVSLPAMLQLGNRDPLHGESTYIYILYFTTVQHLDQSARFYVLSFKPGTWINAFEYACHARLFSQAPVNLDLAIKKIIMLKVFLIK